MVLGTCRFIKIIQLKWRFKTQEASDHEIIKTKQEIELHEVEWKIKKTNYFCLWGGGRYDVLGVAVSNTVVDIWSHCFVVLNTGLLFCSLLKTKIMHDNMFNYSCFDHYSTMHEFSLNVMTKGLRVRVDPQFWHQLGIFSLLGPAPDYSESTSAQIDFLRLLIFLPASTQQWKYFIQLGEMMYIKGGHFKGDFHSRRGGMSVIKGRNVNCHNWQILICK